MKKVNLLTLFAMAVLGTTLMSAQSSRTWVSGVGDDVNPCSRTAPCKTFAGAISKTALGGEIDALDPAGYGALTITKAITIDGGGGQVASVLVAGTNGIVVQAGASDVVILRNLRINGISGSGNGGLNGIRFLSGKSLTVENCDIFGFTQNGIDIATAGGQVFVTHTTSTNNTVSGLNVNSSGSTHVSIDSSHFDGNQFGVNAQNFSVVSVTNTTANGNSNTGFIADASAGGATMSLSHCVASSNVGGIQAGLGGNAGTVNVEDCSLFGNILAGFSIAGASTLKSCGNNYNTGTGVPQIPNLTQQ